MRCDGNRIEARFPMPAGTAKGSVELRLEGLVAAEETLWIGTAIDSEDAQPRGADPLPEEDTAASLFIYGTGNLPQGPEAGPELALRAAAQVAPFDRDFDVTEAVRALPVDFRNLRVTLVVTDSHGRPVDASKLRIRSLRLISHE